MSIILDIPISFEMSSKSDFFNVIKIRREMTEFMNGMTEFIIIIRILKFLTI